MKYNSFSTQKGKLEKAELVNQKQANEISLEQWTESKVNKRAIASQPRNTTLPLTTQWDTEWISSTNTIPDLYYVSWKLNMGRFNINWLSRFAIEILIKNIPTLENKYIGWDIKDVAGSESSNIKDISLVASGSIETEGVGNFEAKLLVKYIAQANHD